MWARQSLGGLALEELEEEPRRNVLFEQIHVKAALGPGCRDFAAQQLQLFAALPTQGE
jgi:hypothetical protein